MEILIERNNLNLLYDMFRFIILKVGLMRNGKIIEEGSPRNILNKHGADTLEAVFLKLCCNQEDNQVFDFDTFNIIKPIHTFISINQCLG